MINKIIWLEEWSLDNVEIDNQHKQLIEILNKITDDDIDINNLVIMLIEYASNHFVDEEILMIRNNYPEKDYFFHKNEHRTFTKALLEVSFGLIRVEESEELDKIIEKLQSFCFTWFNQHFLTVDKAVVTFLKLGGDTKKLNM